MTEVEILSYPPIPEHFINELLIDIKKFIKKTLPFLKKNNGESHWIDYNGNYNPLLLKWLSENIYNMAYPRIGIIAFGNRLLPHTDNSEGETLNFIIEKGGKGVLTLYNLKKEYNDFQITYGPTIDDTYIEKYYEIELPNRLWVKFNTRKIHSVENLNPKEYRIILTMAKQKK